MLNAEKYREKIEQLNYDFALLNSGLVSCIVTPCEVCLFHGDCKKRVTEWLLAEYEEPKIEFEVLGLKVDDKIEVSDDGEVWSKRHFARIEGGKVLTWFNGKSSFSAHSQIDITKWPYARIPREENKS